MQICTNKKIILNRRLLVLFSDTFMQYFVDIVGFVEYSWKLRVAICRLAHTQKKFQNPCYQIRYCTNVISTGAILVSFCLQQHAYYLSQWDKIRTTCVVNLMSQDTKFWLFKINWVRIRTHILQDNTLILYQCATFTLFKFVQIGYLNS